MTAAATANANPTITPFIALPPCPATEASIVGAQCCHRADRQMTVLSCSYTGDRPPVPAARTWGQTTCPGGRNKWSVPGLLTVEEFHQPGNHLAGRLVDEPVAGARDDH